MGKWLGQARYADGMEIERAFPYTANGKSRLEEAEQFCIEEWLINEHPDCVWYSVIYVHE